MAGSADNKLFREINRTRSGRSEWLYVDPECELTVFISDIKDNFQIVCQVGKL